jgi:hypothetical protein
VKWVQGNSTAVGVAEVFEVGRLLNFAKAIAVKLCRHRAPPGGILCWVKVLRQMGRCAELDAVNLATGKDCGCRRPRPMLLFRFADWAGCVRLRRYHRCRAMCSGLCHLKTAHPPRSQLRLQHESAGMACCSGLSTLRTDLCRIRICSRI